MCVCVYVCVYQCFCVCLCVPVGAWVPMCVHLFFFAGDYLVSGAAEPGARASKDAPLRNAKQFQKEWSSLDNTAKAALVNQFMKGEFSWNQDVKLRLRRPSLPAVDTGMFGIVDVRCVPTDTDVFMLAPSFCILYYHTMLSTLSNRARRC